MIVGLGCRIRKTCKGDVNVHDYARQMFQLDELAAKIKVAIDENEVAQVAALTKALKKEQDKVGTLA